MQLKIVKKIQFAFKSYEIDLSLQECYDSYHAWSDWNYCASWENGLDYWNSVEIVNTLLDFIFSGKDESLSFIMDRLHK